MPKRILLKSDFTSQSNNMSISTFNNVTTKLVLYIIIILLNIDNT